MNKLGILFLITAIISCEAQNITDWCPNMARDLKQCETEFLGSMEDVAGSITDAASLLKFHIPNSQVMNVMCHKATIPVFEQFYDCLFGKFFTCIPREWSKAFPDVDEAKKSLKYLCQNRKDIDITCLSSSTRHQTMTRCVESEPPAVTASNVSTGDGFVAHICSLHSKTIACYRSACPKRTAEVLVRAAQYEKPIGCEACVTRPSLYLLSILIIRSLNI